MKNIQTVSKLIARELEYDENEIERINDFFWKAVRRKLSNLESTSVSIKHIGTITVSKRKVDQFIKTTIGKIRSIRKSVRYKPSTQALLLDINFDRLRKALIKRNELAKQYYEAYAKRAKRILPVATSGIEELGESIRGDNQSSEDGVRYTPGREASGDSEKENDLCSVSL